MTGQRQSAYIHLKALDKLLSLTIGSGLDAFIAGDNLEDVIAYIADSSKEGSIPATLALHLDEGSPAYAMAWFLVNHCGLRMIHIRDIFHREWNDVKLAVGQCSLWDVVVLTTVVYNMPHGPWDGGMWFNKVRGVAEDVIRNMNASNPLFTAMYHLICNDLGLVAAGSPSHKAQVLEMVLSGDAFQVRGAKVSLRRGLSWFASSNQHLPLRHQRLMALIALGQATGAYKTLADVPLWTDTHPSVQNWVNPKYQNCCHLKR